MAFVALLLVFAVTGLYAWRLFRAHDRVPTFCYFWAASVIILVTGATYRIVTGSPPSYVDGQGLQYYVSWHTYDMAMLAAALGTACVALGYRWASLRPWRWGLPEFIDSRAPDNIRLKRWAMAAFLAGFIPLLATGLFNPATLIAALLHARALKSGAALALSSQGTYFSFFNAFANLVPFAAAATALLFWKGARPRMLLVLTAFFGAVLFLSGTRSVAAVYLAPLVLVPRYLGNRKLFLKLAVIGAVAGFLLISVQLAYRTIGFEHANISKALAHTKFLNVVDGTQLDWTSQAMQDYGHRFGYLKGRSYLAVLVNPVPRIFWQAKPVGYSSTNAVFLGFNHDTTITSAWIGEAFANFGWAGIPIVGLVAGVLMGILDSFVSRAGPFALAVLLPLQLRFIIWVRGDSVFAFDPWLFGFLILVLALLAAGAAPRANPMLNTRSTSAGDGVTG
jgi:oligosaccharide repeat unit polymerase